MPNQHIPRHGLHPVGFSPQEAATLESFFKIAGQRPPGWWLTPDIRDAAIILLNAQSSDMVDDCRGMMSAGQKVVVVGSSDHGSGWPFVPRPIKLMAILNKINQVLAETALRAPAEEVDTERGALEPAVSQASTYVAPLVPHFNTTVPAAWVQDNNVTASRLPQPEPMIRDLLSPAASAPVRQPAPVKPVAIDAAPSFTPPKTAAPAEPLAPVRSATRVLVVDDSDVALKFMQNRLRQFGYEGQLARSGEEALAMVAETSYRFVFLDVMMAGLDGYQTCRAIKQNKSHHSETPRVIMLTSRGGTIDKIRGSMAGCDAYLTKPLNERQLSAVLGKFDPSTSAAAKLEAGDSQPASRFRDSMFPTR